MDRCGYRLPGKHPAPCGKEGAGGGGENEIGIFEQSVSRAANPSVLRLNQKVLETNGFTIKGVSALSDTEAVLQSGAVKLILLDIKLPDGSGLDFCQTIRSHTSAPILMLSSLHTSQDVISGLLTGGRS